MAQFQPVWPQSEDDPFTQMNTQSRPPLCFDDHQEEIAPKWLLQTDEERLDQQQAVRAMESKLRRINESPITRNQAWMENDPGNSNDEEEEEGDDDYQGDQEGLFLLWQQKYTHDEALLRQKSDRQYVPSGWLSWLHCFCCCSS